MSGRERLPLRRRHEVVEFDQGGFRYIAGISFLDDGKLAKIFLNTSKSGTVIEAWSRDAAVVTPIALQFGASTDIIRKALSRNEDGSAIGPVGLLDMLAKEARNLDDTDPRAAA